MKHKIVVFDEVYISHIKHIVAGSTKPAPSDYTKTQKGGWLQPLDDM